MRTLVGFFALMTKEEMHKKGKRQCCEHTILMVLIR
jgi:hypothetical protein